MATPAPVRAEPPPPVLVRPQRRTVEEVDEPVAVRPDDRHLPRRLDQGALQRPAVARFEEARGVAHRAAGAHAREHADDLHRRVAVDPDEGRVRRGGQLGDGSERGPPRHRGALRVHRPQGAGEPHPVALLDDPPRLAPADHRDAARAHEAGEPGGDGRSRIEWRTRGRRAHASGRAGGGGCSALDAGHGMHLSISSCPSAPVRRCLPTRRSGSRTPAGGRFFVTL